MQNLQTTGLLFVAVWTVTVLLTVLRPQRYQNCLMLMAALFVTVAFVLGFLPAQARDRAVSFFALAVTGALLVVPLLLVVNGIQMLRRESVSLSHLLSLGLGVLVGIGEIAGAVYLLRQVSFGRGHPLGTAALVVMLTVFYFSFLVLSFVLYSAFIQILPHRMNFDYVIIHGCGLTHGDHMTRLLSGRVDKALEVWRKCGKKPVLIPSGGQGKDETVSEAQAMKDYLISRGVPEGSILKEDRSATTEENLRFSKELIQARPGKHKTALVSSNYHVYRCLRLAKKVGLECTGIGAGVALYFWPSALIREFIAVFVTLEFLAPALLGYVLFMGLGLYGLL